MTQVEAMFERFGPKYRVLVTLTVLLGLVALGMSITIVNVATPYIKGAFGMSASQVQWLSTGFLAATTVTLLIAPWLISAFGQRASYIGLLGVFIAASLVGGMATGMGAIVVARVVQGAMTGVIRPVALEALFAVYPPEKRGMATALYGMCLGLPLTLASVVGGYLFTKITQRIPVRIAIDRGPRAQLSPGMMVEVDIDTTHRSGKQRVADNDNDDDKPATGAHAAAGHRPTSSDSD